VICGVCLSSCVSDIWCVCLLVCPLSVIAVCVSLIVCVCVQVARKAADDKDEEAMKNMVRRK
jgi:hypothetical protein